MRHNIQNSKIYQRSCINSKGCLLIRTRCSLISSINERALYNFSKSNIFNKAKVNQIELRILDKIKSDGIISTYESVINKLDSSIPIGNIWK